MVSSGTVQGDLSSINSSLSSCSSAVSDLSSSWKGLSYDSLSVKIEDFISEYTSVLEGEMSAFASACDLYVKYKNTKSYLSNSQRNYDEAVRYNKPDDASRFQTEIDTYRSTLEELKGQIESNLERAAATSLTATPISASVSGGSFSVLAKSSSVVTQAAIDWAINVANDDSHGYSRDTRYGNPNYDCSSLVISAWEAAGVPVVEMGADYTGNMRETFLETGQFKWIDGCPDGSTMTAGDGSPFQPGDIFLAEGVHTEMYVGDGMSVGAHSNYDGYNGDSSGNEINVQNYSQGRQSWDGILRYDGKISA